MTQSGRQQGKSESGQIQFYITACRCALYDQQHVVMVVRDWRVARFRFEQLAQILKADTVNAQQLSIPVGDGSVRFKAVEAEPAWGNRGLIFIDRRDWLHPAEQNPVFGQQAARWEQLAQHMLGKFKVPQPTTPATSL